METKNTNRKLKNVYTLLLGLSTIFVVSIGLTVIFQVFGIQRVQEVIRQSGALGPILFIIFHSATIIAAPLGGEFLMLSAGVMFGFWPGVIYSSIAGFIGASTNFWLARIYGQRIIVKLLGQGSLDKVHSISERITSKNPTILLPLMATTAFDYLAYAVGLTKIKFKNFFIAVCISTIINVPIYVGIGSSIIEGNGLQKLVLVGLTILAIVVFAIEEIIRSNNKKKD